MVINLCILRVNGHFKLKETPNNDGIGIGLAAMA